MNLRTGVWSGFRTTRYLPAAAPPGVDSASSVRRSLICSHTGPMQLAGLAAAGRPAADGARGRGERGDQHEVVRPEQQAVPPEKPPWTSSQSTACSRFATRLRVRDTSRRRRQGRVGHPSHLPLGLRHNNSGFCDRRVRQHGRRSVGIRGVHRLAEFGRGADEHVIQSGGRGVGDDGHGVAHLLRRSGRITKDLLTCQ
jgi:hypothetical protein